jgi:cell division protein FtsI (penicillin-binding protein 3)
LQKLGFGSRVGLPLPGESAGLLHPVKQWKDVELANISFGQGLGVTMLQLADAYLCIANGGVRLPLRLEHGPRDAAEEGRRIFDPNVAKMVMAMLEEVVQGDGTGTQARIEGVRVAGKTGTAQKATLTGGYGEEYVASFVGIFPADTPRYLVCMMVDEPQTGHYGGVLVAPEVRNIGVQLLTLSGMLAEPVEKMRRANVSPERFSTQVQRAENVIVDQNVMPDLQGATLRQALEILVAKGIVPQVIGQGVIIEKQKPLPGNTWPADKKCQLWLTGQPG